MDRPPTLTATGSVLVEYGRDRVEQLAAAVSDPDRGADHQSFLVEDQMCGISPTYKQNSGMREVALGSESEVSRDPQEGPYLGAEQTKSGEKRTSSLGFPLLGVERTYPDPGLNSGS